MGLTDKCCPAGDCRRLWLRLGSDILAKLGGSLWSGVPAAQAEFDDRAPGISETG